MQHLTLTGTPRERGHQHGEHFRDQIREMAAVRRKLFDTYFEGFPEKDVEKLIQDGLKTLAKHKSLYSEFQAISEASGVAEGELLILNNYTDMRDFSYLPAQMAKAKKVARKKETIDAGGCSVFGVRGTEASGKPSSICGQTWDMDAYAAPFVAHLSVKPLHATEPAVELFSVTGCLGLSGVNEHGVAVFINNLHCAETSRGLAWPALVRLMLNQKSAGKALAAMKKFKPASGHNYLVCDAKESLNIETTGKRIVVTDKVVKPGATFHTNHYVSKLKSVEISERRSMTTHTRSKALEGLVRGYDFSRLSLTGVARDFFEGPVGEFVSIPIPKDPSKIPAAVTCGGLIVDLSHRRGVMYAGVWADENRREFRF